MTFRRQQLGAIGEAAAERYLVKQGFKLLHRNLRVGRIGELDLVASEGDVLVFVEVKTRMAGEVLGGFENITLAKQRKLRQLGEAYLQYHPAPPGGARFDAVEVELREMNDSAPLVRHLRDAFR